MKRHPLILVASLAIATTAAQAGIVISKDSSAVQSIPGLTGFATTGAQMDGMQVTVSFSNGLTETRSWADLSANSGGVAGSGWSLTESGDTYGGHWMFKMDGGSRLGDLLSMTFDASASGTLTLFDAAAPTVGTLGSALGLDFDIIGGCPKCSGKAIYSNAVALTGEDAQNDLFHTLTVTFDAGRGPSSNFSFVQDTDNDSRLGTTAGPADRDAAAPIANSVPEPASVLMVALGLLGVAASRRR